MTVRCENCRHAQEPDPFKWGMLAEKWVHCEFDQRYEVRSPVFERECPKFEEKKLCMNQQS